MKNFIYWYCPSTATMGQNIIHRGLSLVSMDSKISNKLDGSHFWAHGHLPTTLEWLKLFPAIVVPNVHFEPTAPWCKSLLKHIKKKYVLLYEF